MKKATLTWDTIGKLVLAVVVLLILIGVVWLAKDKITDLYTKLIDFMRIR